jgi:hypothetical protein
MSAQLLLLSEGAPGRQRRRCTLGATELALARATILNAARATLDLLEPDASELGAALSLSRTLLRSQPQ